MRCWSWWSLFSKAYIPHNLDTLRIEPRASRMLSGCDTTTPCALADMSGPRNTLFGFKVCRRNVATPFSRNYSKVAIPRQDSSPILSKAFRSRAVVQGFVSSFDSNRKVGPADKNFRRAPRRLRTKRSVRCACFQGKLRAPAVFRSCSKTASDVNSSAGSHRMSQGQGETRDWRCLPRCHCSVQ